MARTATITARWRHELVFEGGAEGRPAVVVDGNSKEAISPVELLLVAAATCTAADVVTILSKTRVSLTRCDVAVVATRRDEHPRRVTALALTWTIAGGGADEPGARRAIDLSIAKYCSVMASLAPDVAVSYDVVLA